MKYLLYIIIIVTMLLVSTNANSGGRVIISNESLAATSPAPKKVKSKNSLRLDTALYIVTYKGYVTPDTSLIDAKNEGMTVTLIGKRHAKFMDKVDFDSW